MRWSLIAIALILLVGWIFLWKEPINQLGPNARSLSGQPLPKVPKGESNPILEPVRRVNLSFIDKITKAEVEPIDGIFESPRLANAVEYQGFFPPNGLPLQGVKDLVFQYRLPGGEPSALQQVSIPSSFNPSDGLEIPWTAKLLPKMIDDFSGEILNEASFSWIPLDQRWVQGVEMGAPPPERFCPIREHSFSSMPWSGTTFQ